MAEVKAGGAAAKASPQLSSLNANKRDSKSNSLKAPLNGAAAPGQSVFDSKDYVAGKDNVWQLMLQKASRKAAFPNATMVVVGDKKNGKTALLNKFGERVHNAQTAEYVMDYSYVPVKNRYNADKEEVLGALNVFQWDEPAHADVLQHFARTHGLDNSIYVLTVSLAEPWNVIRSVTTWLNVLVAQHTKILDALPADDRKRLKEKIAAYTQLYVDPSVKKKQQSGDLKSSAATAGELEAAKAAINLNIPKFNIGVPIVIVGTKAEVLSKKASKAAGSDDRFEFLTRRLRKIALDYGATLMYTSAAGAGLNTELLQDYVYHRLYNFPLEAPAKAVVSVANDDVNLYVPAGYDSVELIDPVASAAAGKDKDVVISVGSWTEATPMEEVFADSADQKQKAAAKVAEEVTAPDNASFYRMLQQSMEKDTVRGAGGMAGLSINPNSLSTTGASGAQPGVTGRQSLQIPVSPSAHSGRSAADRATLDKLNALRQAAGGSSAAAGQRTPTHSQSTRDLHSVNSTPSGGVGVGPAQGTPSGAGATAKPGAAGAGAAVGGAAATGTGAAAGKTDMKKTAVKAFFKSLLNGAPSGAAGTTVTTAGSSTSLRTAARDTLGGGNQ